MERGTGGEDAIAHHKMPLIPMQNTGKSHILHKPVERHPDAGSAESYLIGGIADAHQRNAGPGDERPLAQGLQAVAAAVVFGYHAEAGGAAVHLV